MIDYKYNIGPFATDSDYFRFCLQHVIPIKLKEFPGYGIYWSANLTEEDATAFRLKFGRNSLRYFEEDTNEI